MKRKSVVEIQEPAVDGAEATDPQGSAVDAQEPAVEDAPVQEPAKAENPGCRVALKVTDPQGVIAAEIQVDTGRADGAPYVKALLEATGRGWEPELIHELTVSTKCPFCDDLHNRVTITLKGYGIRRFTTALVEAVEAAEFDTATMGGELVMSMLMNPNGA